MQPNDLPCLGPIKAPIDRFYGAPEMDGQHILCIGMSESEIDAMLATRGSASVTVLTLWENHIDSKSGKYPVIIGDVTQRTSFDDGHFDGIVTNSLLEHVSDLSAALREMCRVTKPGAWNYTITLDLHGRLLTGLICMSTTKTQTLTFLFNPFYTLEMCDLMTSLVYKSKYCILINEMHD